MSNEIYLGMRLFGWEDFLAKQPEYGMGFHIATVITVGGKVHRNQVILNGKYWYNCPTEIGLKDLVDILVQRR